MNIDNYQKFLLSHKNFVTRHENRCLGQVISNCFEIPGSVNHFFHGTSQEKAKIILDEGFKINRFEGNQSMGVGVYLTQDELLAQYFGKKLLKVDVDLKSTLAFTAEALKNFRFIKDETFQKILKIIRQNESDYIGDKAVIEEKIHRIIKENEESFFKINMDEKRAKINVLKEEATHVNTNIFHDLLEKLNVPSVHSYNDVYGGINGRAINQWIVTDVSQIINVSA